MRSGSAVQRKGGFTVALAEVSVDRRLQVDERMEDTALQIAGV
jgi:hypothetical protein